MHEGEFRRFSSCAFVSLVVKAILASKPIAAISHPPAHKHDGDGRGQPPPDGQEKIGQQAQHDERDPKNLSFHTRILAPDFPFPRQTYTKVQWRGGSRRSPNLCMPA